MAIAFSGASLVALARKTGVPFRQILMLGRQTHQMTPELITHLQHHYQIDLGSVNWDASPWAEPLFETLGADQIESMDYSNYEGASLIHDLNHPWPGQKPPRQFDIVFDGGTLEHIFNLPQALLNAMSLVKVGGIFLSVTPNDGWLGHGFHQLQPELFFRFFTPERGFKLHGVWLAEHGHPPSRTRVFQLNDPAVTRCRNRVPGRRPLEILVMAEKTAETDTPAHPWPSQSNYTSMWPEGNTNKTTTSSANGGRLLRQAVLKCLPTFLASAIQRHRIQRKYDHISRSTWTGVKSLRSVIPVTGK